MSCHSTKIVPFISDKFKVFTGPKSAGSVPSSVTGYAHRRDRSNSVSRYAYYESPERSDEEAMSDELESDGLDPFIEEDERQIDLEYGRTSPPRFRRSTASENADQYPLLHRSSTVSDAKFPNSRLHRSQKIYIASEDLTLVVAGFGTRHAGSLLYMALCTCTLGLFYVLLRWFPRWKVRLVGISLPLRDCDWVVLEVRFIPESKTFMEADEIRINGAR